MKRRINFSRDIDLFRILLVLLLIVSLLFNYVLFIDNNTMTLRFREVKAGILDNIIGSNYCDAFLENENKIHNSDTCSIFDGQLNEDNLT